jgi:hypothetical protein
MQRSQNTARERQTPQAETTAGWREHIPGFLAVTVGGAHLVDVGPRNLVRDDDLGCPPQRPTQADPRLRLGLDPRRRGEHLFAPALMTDGPAAPRSQQPGGRDRLTYTDLRWPHLATGTRGHYSKLRQRLNDYAYRQAAQIDGNHSDHFPEHKTRRKHVTMEGCKPRCAAGCRAGPTSQSMCFA